MTSGPPTARARLDDGGPVEVPFAWPCVMTKWARAYFLADVVLFIRTSSLTAANQRAFLRLCGYYAERVEVERLAAKIAGRKSRAGRRNYRDLTAYMLRCITRERRACAALGLPYRNFHR